MTTGVIHKHAASATDTAGTAADDAVPERSFTIREFCFFEGIGHATYYRMRRAGTGPQETRVPGTTIVRISPQARRDWHSRMDELRKGEAAKLEEARRCEQAAHAGRKALVSPRHASRRKRGKAA